MSDMNCSISIYDEFYRSVHMSFLLLQILQTTKLFKNGEIIPFETQGQAGLKPWI